MRTFSFWKPGVGSREKQQVPDGHHETGALQVNEKHSILTIQSYWQLSAAIMEAPFAAGKLLVVVVMLEARKMCAH